MGFSSNGRLMSGVSALTLATLFVTPVLGQDQQATTAGTTVLKPIVVTGEKVARDMKNTASSVSVISGDKIKKEKTGDPTVSEAIKDIPNVVYTDNVSAPIIRGQDTQGPNTGSIAFFTGTVPRATINVDGHYLGYNEFIYGASSIWDVESIEVFRGPQTTSQGANAIAGAILVNTKDPTFTPEAGFLAEYGSYATRRTALMLSGPIIKEQLAGRITLDYSGRDTFIDYVSPNFQRRYADQDFRNLNLRAKLLWRPTELPGFEAKLTYSRNESNRPSQEAASFPFSRLKIDRSFIRDIGSSRESMAIVRAIIGLGANLGIDTTAEGVETGAQLELLRQERCGEIQGFLFSPPVDSAGALRIIDSYRGDESKVA